jgi:hypothetical protein
MCDNSTPTKLGRKPITIHAGERFGYWGFIENIAPNKGKFLCHSCDVEFVRQISAIKNGRSKMCFSCNLILNNDKRHDARRANAKNRDPKTSLMKPGDLFNYWKFIKSTGNSRGEFLCTRCDSVKEKYLKTIKHGISLACSECTKKLNLKERQKKEAKTGLMKSGDCFHLWRFNEVLPDGRGIFTCTGCDEQLNRKLQSILSGQSKSCLRCAVKTRRKKVSNPESKPAKKYKELIDPIEVNASYGLKTVLSIDEESEKVLVQCSCGFRSTYTLAYFKKTGRSTKCIQCKNTRKKSFDTSQIGYRSGWLVLTTVKEQNTGIFLCEGCGKHIERSISNIKINGTKSCIDCRTKYKREKKEEQNRRRQVILNS